jgi:hypothetical protein
MLCLASVAAAAETHTVTFKPAEGPGEFVIPVGVSGVEVLAVGAAGQEGGSCTTAPGGKGGTGAKASAAVPTSAVLNLKLFVEFGGVAGGGGGAGGKAFTCNAGAGGAGGGASDLRAEESTGKLLLVAGGGGGGGGAGASVASDHGGAGGSTEGVNGHSGEAGLFEGAARGKGGEGATTGAAGKQTGTGKGAGGAGDSTPGHGGAGGEAAQEGGGGGGGGYNGGGGGEAGEYIAGGGGAGASFAAGVTELSKFTSAEAAPQQIVITYEGGPAVGGPSVTLESPGTGGIYDIGQVVTTKFKCKEGLNGPGLSSCKDSNGVTTGEGELKTEHGGEFQYTVTAISKSGKTASKTITYRVAAPPQVHITPASGGFYLLNQIVKTTFSCTEGAGGATLLSCTDSNGQTGGTGELLTSPAGEGEYSVTAISSDGLETTAKINYRVLEGEKLAIFSSSGACTPWTVPAGVVEPVEVFAIGGAGKAGQSGNAVAAGNGGQAGELVGMVKVAEGRQLEVCVGEFGGEGGANEPNTRFAAGGAGGGLSGLFGSAAHGEPLVVAAGGGGGAGSSSAPAGNGGNAGNAGASGERGWDEIEELPPTLYHEGGLGGEPGGNGGLQAGGSGAEAASELSSAGGGGGAGVPGGGGGESFPTGGLTLEASGGGGGGGTNYCAASASCTEALAPVTQKPAVAIVYSVTAAPSVTVTSPVSGATYLVGDLLFAEYECEELGISKLKPGAEGCYAVNEGGTKVLKGAQLPTTRAAHYTLKVTASSVDGLTTTDTVKYSVAARPGVTISGPVSGRIYALNALVHASFECFEGASGPGLFSCFDSEGKGTEPGHLGVARITGSDTLDTKSAGDFDYLVEALSYDGAGTTKAVKYIVAAPPEVTISMPSSGGVYRLHQVVSTSFSCTEGSFGSGLFSCGDSNGSKSGSGALRTAEVGEHTYTVSAKSKDGQAVSKSIHYRVALPPKAFITFPKSGAVFFTGEIVETTYHCEEGVFGPGLSTCGGLATASGHATLNTAGFGQRVYEVTAVSTDGQEGSASIRYTVD